MYIVSLKASALLESVFVESKQRWQNMFHHFLLSSMSSEACRATKEHLYTDAHGCFRCRSWASQAGIYTIGVTGEWGADDWNWWGALVAAGNDRIWNDRLKNTAWWWISGKRELRMNGVCSRLILRTRWKKRSLGKYLTTEATWATPPRGIWE